MFTILLEELGKFLVTANVTMKDMNQFVLMVAFASFVILFSITSCICRIIDAITTAFNERLETKAILKERERLKTAYLLFADDVYKKGDYDECRKMLSSYYNDDSIMISESGEMDESSNDAKHQSGKKSVSE